MGRRIIRAFSIIFSFLIFSTLVSADEYLVSKGIKFIPVKGFPSGGSKEFSVPAQGVVLRMPEYDQGGSMAFRYIGDIPEKVAKLGVTSETILRTGKQNVETGMTMTGESFKKKVRELLSGELVEKTNHYLSPVIPDCGNYVKMHEGDTLIKELYSKLTPVMSNCRSKCKQKCDKIVSDWVLSYPNPWGQTRTEAAQNIYNKFKEIDTLLKGRGLSGSCLDQVKTLEEQQQLAKVFENFDLLVGDFFKNPKEKIYIRDLENAILDIRKSLETMKSSLKDSGNFKLWKREDYKALFNFDDILETLKKGRHTFIEKKKLKELISERIEENLISISKLEITQYEKEFEDYSKSAVELISSNNGSSTSSEAQCYAYVSKLISMEKVSISPELLAKLEEGVYSSNYSKSSRNPEVIHPNMDPYIPLCIVLHESKSIGGVAINHHPFVPNYTFCEESGRLGSPRSLAVGSGQITKTTLADYIMRGIIPVPPVTYQGLGNVVDWTRKLPDQEEIDRIRSIQDDEIRKNTILNAYDYQFSIFHKEPMFQLEATYHLLNSMLKEKNGDIKAAIGRYDQDTKSTYVNNFLNCHNCMKRIGVQEECFPD